LSDDSLPRIAELLERANRCQKEKRPVEADLLVAEAKQLAAVDRHACAVVDLFCATTFLEQDNPGQGLRALASMLSEYRDWFASPVGRPMYEFIQIQRAFSLIRLGRNLEARPLLEAAIQFDLDAEEIDEGVRSDVHCHLGRCYHELSLYQLAREQFQQANALGVSEKWQPTFHYYYGYTLYQLKEFQRAKREFILCLQSGPSDQEASMGYAMLAATSHKLGEHSEARSYEEKASLLKR
jgi:tetratricopeptide (TPR) repeat protein